jgi:CheY-like chemotaxis protein
MQARALAGAAYDLVITDVELAGVMNGLALCWISRQLLPEARSPFVIMSGANIEALLNAEEKSADYQDATTKVLRKPFLAREFVGVVKSLLEARYPAPKAPAPAPRPPESK